MTHNYEQLFEYIEHILNNYFDGLKICKLNDAKKDKIKLILSNIHKPMTKKQAGKLFDRKADKLLVSHNFAMSENVISRPKFIKVMAGMWPPKE